MNRQRLLLFSLLATFACGSDAPTTPTTDWIELKTVIPAAGTALTAGERVTFTATVTCTIVGADGGTVVLLLMDQGNRSLQPAGQQPTPMPVTKGTQTVTLSETIEVPASGSTVTLAVPLFVTGSNATRAVTTRQYTVR